jgi:hypothetical protein
VTRTRDPLLRRQMLYPTELRAPGLYCTRMQMHAVVTTTPRQVTLELPRKGTALAVPTASEKTTGFSPCGALLAQAPQPFLCRLGEPSAASALIFPGTAPAYPEPQIRISLSNRWRRQLFTAFPALSLAEAEPCQAGLRHLSSFPADAARGAPSRSAPPATSQSPAQTGA